MKSPYVSELQANQPAQGTFLVTYKEVRHKKSGEPYLSMTLADRTGDLDAKMWDNAAEVADAFDRDDFVHIKGLLQVFQNRPQLTVHKLQPVAAVAVDISDFLPASKRDRDEMFREIEGWIEGMGDPHFRGLLQGIFSNPAVALAFRTAPAAKTVHHAWIGGLIEHVLSLCNLAKMTAAHYSGIDFDLLLAGVILHDIGKIHELEYARSIRYTDAGQLLGHIQIGMQMVTEQIARMPDFPPRQRDLLLHLILSHHGQLEFGSPKLPVFPEAMLLHLLDNMDSKMESMRGLIERDRLMEGNWTGYSAPLERSILKKQRYLDPPPPPEPAARPHGNTPHAAPANSPFAAKLRGALGKES
jgi:3'-5' exoribonuclease